MSEQFHRPYTEAPPVPLEQDEPQNQSQQAETSQQQQVDPARLRGAVERLRSEQNFPLGILAGFTGAVVGAIVWATVTVMTGYQIGWMAVGVGFLVGFLVRAAGKGLDPIFGVTGAVLALFGCALGNLLAVCGMISLQESISIFQILSRLNFSAVKELMAATFSPIDLLFYGIAVYEGYKLSFRQVSEEELPEPATGSVTP